MIHYIITPMTAYSTEYFHISSRVIHLLSSTCVSSHFQGIDDFADVVTNPSHLTTVRQCHTCSTLGPTMVFFFQSQTWKKAVQNLILACWLQQVIYLKLNIYFKRNIDYICARLNLSTDLDEICELFSSLMCHTGTVMDWATCLFCQAAG